MSTNYSCNKDGVTINPASETKQRDIENKLEEIRVETKKHDLLAGPDYKIVTTTSRTLEQMGVTLNAALTRVTLIPDSIGIYWANGTATSTSSAKLPDASIEIDCSKDTIATREFVVASGTVKMMVMQEG